jgi:RHS repeat-associated protein
VPIGIGGQTIAMRQGTGSPTYLLSDQLGSSTTVTDNSGNVIATNRYWPFGGVRSSTGSTPTDRLFTGQRQEPPGDNALGLYNYNARFYSATLGRFISVDPVGGSESDPQGWNAYAYVRNNPLAYTDPTGMFGWSDITEAAQELWDNGTSLISGGRHAAGDAVDLGIEKAKAATYAVADVANDCWGNELCQAGVIGAGVAGCSFATGAPVACGMAGAALASLDNAAPCAHGSAGDCAAIGVEFGAVALGAGGGNAIRNFAERQIESSLRRSVAQGVARLAAEGVTERQAAAAAARPGLRAAFEGERVDTFAKEALAETRFAKYFARMPSRFQFGPDFRSRLTGRWYDITTNQREFGKKKIKYAERFGEDAVGLFY